jgi:hypothetical protein
MDNSVRDFMASRCNSQSIWLKTGVLMGTFHVEFQQNTSMSNELWGTRKIQFTGFYKLSFIMDQHG